jgi:FkbM family methyltransferase
MGIRRVFMVGRYLRCRKIFRNPMRAHLYLAFVRKEPAPFELTFLNGEVWRHQPPKRMWDFWDNALFGRSVELPISLREGLLEFGHHGRRVYVRPDTDDYFIFREVYDRDVYELNSLSDLDTVVDLGGQSGMFASRAATVARRVITVEAWEANVELLKRNLAGSGCADRVTVVHRAVARTSGESVRIYENTGNSGGHSVDARIAGGTRFEEVTTVSMDDLFKQHAIERCGLLKCDIEGGEYEAFAGASDDTLRRIQRITAEVHGVDGATDPRLEGLKARLESLGFSIRAGESETNPGTGVWMQTLIAARNGVS